jgi:repressor of nif and glnA expression
MVYSAGWETERKIKAILNVLRKSPEPLGSLAIARKLGGEGFFLSERAVRNLLRITDERGYTEPKGHNGRMITQKGVDEVRDALVPEQLGSIRDKLEMLAFQNTFDPEKQTGQLTINTSLIDEGNFRKAVSAMRDVFKAGICITDLVATASEDERLGSVTIPKGKIGLATVSSVIINGVLLKAGVPTEYRFGGLLEVRKSKPHRFLALMEYAGTSVDPSEQFIKAKMTSVTEVARTGNGKVLGVFRTIPSPARPIAEKTIALLKDARVGGVLALGNIGESVCQIPVALNRVAILQLGGLNPVAAAVEAGIEIENVAESGLIDFQQLRSFWEL